MSKKALSVEQVQAMILRSPFHQWLGITVLHLGDGEIEIKAAWRNEWMVNPERGHTHGGILAVLVDLAAHWALVSRTGRSVPTLDLSVDYHDHDVEALPGDLTARGKMLEWYPECARSKAQVFDLNGALVASGSGLYPNPFFKP